MLTKINTYVSCIYVCINIINISVSILMRGNEYENQVYYGYLYKIGEIYNGQISSL